MSIKEVFLQQFSALNAEKNWTVTMENALKGLTFEQAMKKDSAAHSIHEIVNHLIYWNGMQIKMFNGTFNPVHTPDNESTFIDEKKYSEEKWRESVNKILELFSEWVRVIENSDDSKFESDFRGDPFYSFLANVTIHNAYHIGQIVLIRKQNGNWDSKLGVK